MCEEPWMSLDATGGKVFVDVLDYARLELKDFPVLCQHGLEGVRVVKVMAAGGYYLLDRWVVEISGTPLPEHYEVVHLNGHGADCRLRNLSLRELPDEGDESEGDESEGGSDLLE